MVNTFEFAFIAFILLFVYKKYIKGTPSEKLVKGIFILLLTWLFSEILILINLKILGVALRSLVGVVTLSLIVIFQPELRRFLGYLGQNDFLSISNVFNKKSSHYIPKINIVNELVDSIKYLSKTKIGALIVLLKSKDRTSYSEVGTALNANISTELILTIFHPNTPLHDGAMTIYNDKILAAGVLLPLTEDPKLSWRYGTRHRAAIGMSEISDCACIVISEETGDISIAIDGMLKKYEDISLLRGDLEFILGLKEIKMEDETTTKTLFNFINIKQKNTTQKSDKAQK